MISPKGNKCVHDKSFSIKSPPNTDACHIHATQNLVQLSKIHDKKEIFFYQTFNVTSDMSHPINPFPSTNIHLSINFCLGEGNQL
jgi:hypothetical protein